MLPIRLPTTTTTAGVETGNENERPIKKSRKPKSTLSGTEAQGFSPETIALIQAMIDETVRRLYVEPHAEAFSISEFCTRYGISRTTAYEQIKHGWLKAKKPQNTDRTLIRRVDAEHWITSAPLMKPGDSDEYQPR